MAAISRSRLTRWIAPVGAIVAWIGVAATLLAKPARIDDLLYATGLPATVSALAPPLGSATRIGCAIGAGAVAAMVVWSALFLLFGPGGLLDRGVAGETGTPVVRHADVHPDAPPRRPLSAMADLGAPLPAPPPAVRPIPADLDQPIAAFHPAAIPDVPREPVRPVAPLVSQPLIPQPLAAGEWIETVDLTPPASGEATPPTIEALLQRLEAARPRRLQSN